MQVFPAQVITGYGRTGWDRRATKFGSIIHGMLYILTAPWFLLDATWASGYINFRGDEFTREYKQQVLLNASFRIHT
ncbi:MAG: hypothetical protein WDO16_19370 [Bacteroidota bacterium]